MNLQIQIIETKIQEIKNLLTNWTQSIATYQSQLQEIINQVNTLKENMNNKTKAPEALNNKNKK